MKKKVAPKSGSPKKDDKNVAIKKLVNKSDTKV